MDRVPTSLSPLPSDTGRHGLCFIDKAMKFTLLILVTDIPRGNSANYVVCLSLSWLKFVDFESSEAVEIFQIMYLIKPHFHEWSEKTALFSNQRVEEHKFSSSPSKVTPYGVKAKSRSLRDSFCWPGPVRKAYRRIPDHGFS
ncbi:hypothetical protein OIU78_012800 [Salix suchowensis]|nr:hypothetical protein OIU78_012800 [Salix suchowensis]